MTNNNIESEIAYSDDLPDDLKKELKKNDGLTGNLRPTIMRIIGENGQVTVNDLLIGLYRSKEVVMRRPALLQHLKILRDRGVAESPTRGVFQLTDHGEQMFAKACGK